MQLDGKDVPIEIIEVWLSIIERLSAAEIRKLAARHPSISRGFRPSSIDTGIARDRLKSLVRKAKELPKDIRENLRWAGLTSSLLIVFSEEVLVEIVDPLAGIYGNNELAAALLLDDRLSVRTMAHSLLKPLEIRDQSHASPDFVAGKLATEIGPFLHHMREILDLCHMKIQQEKADSSITGKVGDPIIAKRHAINAPRRRNEANLLLELRKKKQELIRVKRDYKKVETRYLTAYLELEELSQNLVITKDALLKTNTKLVELQAQFDIRVADAVELELTERLVPWLRPAEDLLKLHNKMGLHAVFAENEASSACIGDDNAPVQFAKQILQRQADVDLKYGLRSALRLERELCSDLKSRLLMAQSDSLRPLPEIAVAVEGLDLRVKGIDEALGEKIDAMRGEGTSLSRFHAALSAATSLSDLAELRRVLLASKPLGLFYEEEFQKACVLLGNAVSREYARARLDKKGKLGTDNYLELPLYSLQLALSQGDSCSLLVDGHNVLWGLQSQFSEYFDYGMPKARAREALATQLAHLADQYSNLAIELWFDSDLREDRALKENMRLHFSGGFGANRADGQLLAYLEYVSSCRVGDRAFVVTEDRAILSSAIPLGAAVMTPLELSMLFIEE